MKVILITPGTGSYYCGVCMRDNALARELIRQGHEAIMAPCYLPLQLDEEAVSSGAPTFFGGVNVFLQDLFWPFRHTPRWLDRIFDHPALLRWVGGRQRVGSGKSLDRRVSRITHSMLEGESGRQRKELARLVAWLKEMKPDAVWLSTALLTGLARRIKQELGVPVLASLQGEDTFLDKLANPWSRRCWELLTERAADVDCFIAPSQFYAKLMGGRLRIAPARLQVIPNGISLEGYGEPRPRPQVPVIGFLARMTEEKGLGLLVDAFLLLKSRPGFGAVKLRVAGAQTAGDAEYVETLRARIAKAGREEDVEFLPNLGRDEKIAFLHSLTLLSVPALYPEASGLYVLEAWAAGVPVVQPRAAAFTELVGMTGAGRLAGVGIRLTGKDLVEELVLQWLPYLSDPELACADGLRGRDAVSHGALSLSRMAEAFVEATQGVSERQPVATSSH